ncbi:MAG TPA: cupin-like domain-containing protein [Capsulimonadaceae bacterium]|jgi:hypothetical protein
MTNNESGMIDRRSNLAYDEFASNYLFANKPVVLTDAASKWTAIGKWDLDYLKTHHGSVEVPLDGTTYRVADYVDLVHASTASSPAPYMRNQNIAKLFPELMADLDPLPAVLSPNWLHHKYFPPQLQRLMSTNSVLEAFIGGPGATFPVIHFDSMYTHAFLTQVHGTKKLMLWDPTQSNLMYATKRNNVSDVNDVLKPDLEKYPRFADAKAAVTDIGPGDTAFIPSGWWHTALMLTESITVSANVVNKSNWRDVSRDIVRGQSPLIAGPFLGYLTFLGALKDLLGA